MPEGNGEPPVASLPKGFGSDDSPGGGTGRPGGGAGAEGLDLGAGTGTDIQAPGRLLAALRATEADYVHELGLPYGAAVEAVTRDALVRASHEATEADDRQHVTTYGRRNPNSFRAVQLAAPTPLRRPDVRLTVDTADDLAHVRTIFERTSGDLPPLRHLIEAAGRPAREVA